MTGDKNQYQTSKWGDNKLKSLMPVLVSIYKFNTRVLALVLANMNMYIFIFLCYLGYRLTGLEALLTTVFSCVMKTINIKVCARSYVYIFICIFHQQYLYLIINFITYNKDIESDCCIIVIKKLILIHYVALIANATTVPLPHTPSSLNLFQARANQNARQWVKVGAVSVTVVNGSLTDEQVHTMDSTSQFTVVQQTV